MLRTEMDFWGNRSAVRIWYFPEMLNTVAPAEFLGAAGTWHPCKFASKEM